MKILCVGNINYDIQFKLDTLPEPHEKIICNNTNQSFGGSAANTAHWLAKLGVSVTLAGTVGNDPIGAWHLEAMEKTGVDISGVNRIDQPTGVTVIMASGREKRMIKTPGANMGGKVNREILQDCQLLYLSGDNIALFVEYARIAHESGVRIFCGGNTAVEDVLLEISTGAILNHDELRNLTGLNEPEEGLQALDLELAAVTLPTGGCIVSQGVKIEEVKAPEIEPVDRTGGGDAFAAGFLAGIASDRSIRESGVMGNLLAAEVISYPGTRPNLNLPESLHNND